MKKNNIVSRFKKSNLVEKNLNFGSEIVDYKNKLVDKFIILQVKGQIIKLERNFNLSIDEQITSFKNRYKLSLDNTKNKIKQTKFITEQVKKRSQTIETINFFKD